MKIQELFSADKDNPLYGFPFILGKILKGSGLKLTHDSLLYEKKLGLDNHQSVVGSVLITQDVYTVLSLLEMDPIRFRDGFRLEDDIFLYLITTPYLKSSKFRELNKKYKQVFYDFKDFLDEHDINTPGKNITLEHIDSVVDFEFIEQVQKLDDKEKRKRESILKFNGKRILERHPGLEPQRLGQLMTDFKMSFGTVELYRDFLLGNSTDDIMNKFEETVNI